MSDNWIVQNLNSALSTWSEKMAELWTLLTENPATFKGGGIWRIMVNINDALTAIAYGLLVLFFAAGIIKTCGSFTDLKKPEHPKNRNGCSEKNGKSGMDEAAAVHTGRYLQDQF